MKEKDYTPTLEDVKPFINNVTLNFDTRKNWGAADSAYVKMAESLAQWQVRLCSRRWHPI